MNGETRTALETHLKGATWEIERIDADGTAAAWTIRIVTAMPQAQTAGTVLVCTKAANGKTVTDLEGMTVIDIGGGDLQETEVTINPYQLIARRPGDGTIRVARALMEKFPRVSWNAVLAQQSLITRTLMMLINHGLSSLLNAVGAFFGVLFLAQRKGLAMSRTQTKGIRLTEGELARARAVAPLHPVASSEAELLRTIFVRGLLLEEAGLAATGALPAGMTEGQLAAGVLAPTLAALQFLNRAGVVGLAVPEVAAEPAVPDEGLEEAAAEDVSGLGGAFL